MSTHPAAGPPGLHVRELRGSPDPQTPTVLWVHGYTLNADIWTALWEALPNFRHVALDLPGHGRSCPLRASDSFDTLVDAVTAVARSYDATNLIGVSFGGTVALHAAIAMPGIFRSLVLASPGLSSGPQDPECADCHQALIAMARERGIGPWLAARWTSVPPRIFAGAAQQPALMAELAGIVARHPWDELLGGQFSSTPAQIRRETKMARIDAATTIIVGEHDMPAFSRAAELIRRSIPGAQKRYLPGCRHLTILEDPVAGAKMIAEAIASWESRPRHRPL